MWPLAKLTHTVAESFNQALNILHFPVGPLIQKKIYIYIYTYMYMYTYYIYIYIRITKDVCIHIYRERDRYEDIDIIRVSSSTVLKLLLIFCILRAGVQLVREIAVRRDRLAPGHRCVRAFL